MKKILITGASGFIGSFYVEEALKRGWEVWAGVRTSSNLDYLTDPNIHFIDLNYNDSLQLEAQIQEHVLRHGRWNYVIHNAGLTKCLDESDFDRVNYHYTRSLVEALKNKGNLPDKLVFMSSLGAFGPGDEAQYTPIGIQDSPRPNSAYGRSKIKAERYIETMSGCPYIVLRPTGVYGPRDKDYFQMISMINKGLDLAMGYKRQMLTFIYVQDLVDVCFASLESPVKNKTWFVTDGNSYSSKDFSTMVKVLLKKKVVLRLILPLGVVKVAAFAAAALSRLSGKPSVINPDKYRLMKQRNWTCDLSSLTNDLGFVPRYDLLTGLAETIAWYKTNNWL